jgi:hypothetical protein
MFAAFLRGNGADELAPLELVSLIDENSDLLPQGAEGEALESRLADKLLALDLPQRAGPVLEKLIQAAPTGAGRATFGARLAAMRLREGDAPGALAALSASEMTDLPADLIEHRTLLLAEAQAHNGDTQHAFSTEHRHRGGSARNDIGTCRQLGGCAKGAGRLCRQDCATRWRAG